MNSTTRKWPDNHHKHPIYRLLDSSADGKIVLQSYLTNEFLSKNVRNLLSRIVIKKEQDLHLHQLTVGGVLPQLKRFVISRAKFTELASQICELFPSENPHTYYKPFESVNKVKINPSGTLYEHYEYRKKKLRLSGLLASSHANNNHENNVPNVSNSSIQKDLIWLSEHVGPENTVTEKWTATYMTRQALLKQEHLSIFDYYNQLRCLMTKLGPKLLKSDFQRLQPDAGDFCIRWTYIREHLIRRLQLCNKIKSISDKALLHVISTLFPNNKDTVLLYLLPYLIGSSSRKRKNKDQTGARLQTGSIEEGRSSFILHVETAADTLPAIERLKEKLRVLQLTLQPLPILVGPLTGIEAAYVLVNDILYTVNSSLEAVDLCFKIYVALDCAYPERSSPFWLFIQKSLYGIHFKGDVCCRSLNGLIGEITHIITQKESAQENAQKAVEELI